MPLPPLEGYDEDIEARMAELQELLQTMGQAPGDVTLFEVEGGFGYSLADSVLFDSGSADIKAEGERLLRGLVEELTAAEFRRIWGARPHRQRPGEEAGRRGSASPHGNIQLSAARAIEVAALLTSAGVDPNRVAVAGFGASEPIAKNDSAEGKRKNRRVEIFVIERGGRVSAGGARWAAVAALLALAGGCGDAPLESRALLDLERLTFVPAGRLRLVGPRSLEVPEPLLFDRFEVTRDDWFEVTGRPIEHGWTVRSAGPGETAGRGPRSSRTRRRRSTRPSGGCACRRRRSGCGPPSAQTARPIPGDAPRKRPSRTPRSSASGDRPRSGPSRTGAAPSAATT